MTHRASCILRWLLRFAVWIIAFGNVFCCAPAFADVVVDIGTAAGTMTGYPHGEAPAVVLSESMSDVRARIRFDGSAGSRSENRLGNNNWLQRNPDVNADHVAPVVDGLRIDLLRNGWLSKRLFTLTGEVLDPLPGTGVASAVVELMRVGGMAHWQAIRRMNLGGLAEIHGVVPFQVEISVPADGAYRLRVIATDAAGNIGVPTAGSEIAFHIDTLPPEVRWQRPRWIDHSLEMTLYDEGIGLDPDTALRMAQVWPMDYSQPMAAMKTSCYLPRPDDNSTLECTLAVPPGLMGQIMVNYLVTDRLNSPISETHLFQMRTPAAQTVAAQLSLVNREPALEAGGLQHVVDGQLLALRMDVAVKLTTGGLSLDYALPAGLMLDGTADAGPGDTAPLSSKTLAAWHGKGNLLQHYDLVGHKRVVIDIPVRAVVDAPMPRVGKILRSGYSIVADSMKGLVSANFDWIADAVVSPVSPHRTVSAVVDLSAPETVVVFPMATGGYDTGSPTRWRHNVLTCRSSDNSSHGACATSASRRDREPHTGSSHSGGGNDGGDGGGNDKGNAEDVSTIRLRFTELGSRRVAELILHGRRIRRGLDGHDLPGRALNYIDTDAEDAGADAEARFSVWLDARALSSLPGAGHWSASLRMLLRDGEGRHLVPWDSEISLDVDHTQAAAVEFHKQVAPLGVLSPGAAITYSINFHNRGPATLHALAIRDRAPRTTILVSAHCPPEPEIDCTVHLNRQADAGTSDAQRCRALDGEPGVRDVAWVPDKAQTDANTDTDTERDSGPGVLWCLSGDILPGAAHAVTYRVRIDR